MKKNIEIFALIGFITFYLTSCASVEPNYRKTQKLDTIVAYEEFIKSYPDSEFTKDARKRLNELKEKKAFEETETINTQAAYKEFVSRYPNSEFAEEAKRRIAESDDEAFIRTIRIGGVQAFQGFMKSYSNSKYFTVAKERIAFLNVVATDKLDECRSFVKQHPNNHFAIEAITSFPILWLKKQKKVGVVISVGEFVSWQGVFKGGQATKEEVYQKVNEKLFVNLKNNLEKENIQVILLDGLNDSRAKDVQIILVIEYKEEKRERKVEDHSLDESTMILLLGVGPYLAIKTFEASKVLGETLIDELAGPPVNISASIIIKNGNTGYEYYYNLHNLKDKVDRDRMVRALVPFGEEAIPSLLIALYDKNEGIQKMAAMALEKITKQDLEKDPSKWHIWWEENEDKFLKVDN